MIPSKQVALITGASSGFGFETAKLLASRGWRVYAAYRNVRKAGSLQKLAKSLDVHSVRIDTTDLRSIEKAVKDIVRQEGRIDALVNNAGFAMAGFLEDLSDEELKAQFNTNVFGYLRMARAVAPVMRANGSGRIVNIGSISGQIPFPGLGAYVASKFAVRALSEGMRRELWPFGIRVCEIEPGSYKTQVVDSARYGKDVRKPASPYRDPTRWMEKASAKSFSNGRPAHEVAELIGKILDSSIVKPIYVTGPDAKVAVFLKWILPDTLFERLMTSIIPWSRFPKGAA